MQKSRESNTLLNFICISTLRRACKAKQNPRGVLLETNKSQLTKKIQKNNHKTNKPKCLKLLLQTQKEMTNLHGKGIESSRDLSTVQMFCSPGRQDLNKRKGCHVFMSSPFVQEDSLREFLQRCFALSNLRYRGICEALTISTYNRIGEAVLSLGSKT